MRTGGKLRATSFTFTCHICGKTFSSKTSKLKNLKKRLHRETAHPDHPKDEDDITLQYRHILTPEKFINRKDKSNN